MLSDGFRMTNKYGISFRTIPHSQVGLLS